MHSFRSSHGQSCCRWCGAYRSAVKPCLSDEAKAALRAFAQVHGRSWKAALRRCWETGVCPDQPPHLIAELRTRMGPSRLDKLPKSLLKVTQKAQAE